MSSKRQLPYQDSPVPVDRTKLQIEDLLAKAGATAVRWTTSTKERPLIEFIVSTSIEGVHREIGFRIRVPALVMAKGGEKIVNERASWRLVYYWLKAKLEAVRFGMQPIEQELLAQMILALPDGKGNIVSTTAGEEVVKEITRPGKKHLLPTFDIKYQELPEGDSE